jgi:hypothetical protein
MVVWLVFKVRDNGNWEMFTMTESSECARAVATLLGKPPTEARDTGNVRWELGSDFQWNFLEPEDK